MKKLRISLIVKIIFLSLILVSFASLTMQFFAYRTATNAIEQTIGETALNIARSVVGSIQVDRLEALQGPEDMNDEYYLQLREHLNTLRESIGLKYLYTMRKMPDGSYIYVVDGAPLHDEEASLLGDVEEEIFGLWELSFEGKEGYELSQSEEWGDLVSAYIPIKNSAGETVGMLGADFDAGHVFQNLEKTRRNMEYTSVVIAIIGMFLGTVFAFLLIRSLKQLQDKIKLVQDGDLTVQVSSNRTDEVGKLSQAVQSMVESTATIIRNIRTNTKHVAQYIQHISGGHKSDQANDTLHEIAAGRAEQISSIADVTLSMEEVFKQVVTITDNIKMVTAASNKSMQDSQKAMEILASSVKQINLVNDTVDTTATMMKQLEKKFQEIQDFSESVSAIAKQTNLLSLNAGVEAARAGVHGKGFAVVAGEIKILTGRSSEASKKINELITSIQQEINNSSNSIENGVIQARDGVRAIEQVDKYLEKLYSSNNEVDSRVKAVAQAIIAIEKDSKDVLQHTIMLRENLTNVKSMMEDLEKTVNRFRIQ